MNVCIRILHYVIGIANRAIRPLLGIVDPIHTRHMPKRVAINTGFDVFWYVLILLPLSFGHFELQVRIDHRNALVLS